MPDALMDAKTRQKIIRRYLNRPREALGWKLKGLELEQAVQDVYDNYEADIRAATGRAREELREELFAELRQPQANLAIYETQRWERLATRYHVRVPEQPAWRGEDSKGDEHWELSEWGNRWVLTEAGKAEIRRLLRDEQAWRRERFMKWAGLVLSAAGLSLAYLGAKRLSGG
jgi:hypothetical protein